jgi:ribosomal protein S18 acetylase RimI-like enzyme
MRRGVVLRPNIHHPTPSPNGGVASLARGFLAHLRPRWTVVTFWEIDPAGFVPDDPLPDCNEIWWLPGRVDLGEASLAIAAASGLSASVVAARLVGGAHWAGLAHDGEVASTGWISTGSAYVGEIGCWLTPASGEAYVWDFRTLPRFRGHGFYPALLRAVVHRLGEAGTQRIWIGAEWQNWQSIVGIAHAGFRPVALVAALRVGGAIFRYFIASPDVADSSAEMLQAALSRRPWFGDQLTEGRRPRQR